MATAPEYMEQKATIDAMAALAFGLYTHVNPVPFVTGAPRLVKLVTQDLPDVTGGKLAVETDAQDAVAGMMAWIGDKRAALDPDPAERSDRLSGAPKEHRSVDEKRAGLGHLSR